MALATASQAQRETQFSVIAFFSNFTAITDSLTTGDVTSWSDPLGGGYLPNQLQIGWWCMDATGRLFRIKTINSTTFSSANLTLVELQDENQRPFGTGTIFEPFPNEMIPPAVANALGISPVLRSKIDIHNSSRAQLAAASADTTRILQDSIAVYYSSGVETGRDTIRPAVKNLFTTNGALTGPRILDGNAWNLTFTNIDALDIEAGAITMTAPFNMIFGGNGETISFQDLSLINFSNVFGIDAPISGAINITTPAQSLIKLGSDASDAAITASGAGRFYTVGTNGVYRSSSYFQPGRLFINNHGTGTEPLLRGLEFSSSRGTLLAPAAAQTGDTGNRIRWKLRDNNGYVTQWRIYPTVTVTPGGTGQVFTDLVFDGDPTVLSSGEALRLIRGGDVRFSKYLNTRNDTLTTTPINFLYTDINGNLKAAPLSYSGIGGGGGGGTGEANDGVNIGTGAGIYAGKTGVSLQLRSLAGIGGITTTVNGNNVDIDGSTLQAGIDGNTTAIQDTAAQIRADLPDVPGILSANNVTYGTGSAGRPAEWLTDSTLTFNNFTQGSIPYIDAGGGFTQSNGRLFYDAATNRLGINTNAPSYRFDARDTSTATNSNTTVPSFDFYRRRSPSGATTGTGYFANTQIYTDFGTAFSQGQVIGLRNWIDLNQAASYQRVSGVLSGNIQLTPGIVATVDTMIGTESYNFLEDANTSFLTGAYNANFLRGGTHAKVSGTHSYLGIASTATVTDARGMSITINGPSTNKYGILINPFTGTTAGSSYAIYSNQNSPSYFLGNIGIGVLNSGYAIDASGKTGAIVTPGGTSGQRPPHKPGALRWNSTLGAMEYSSGASWFTINAGAAGGGNDGQGVNGAGWGLALVAAAPDTLLRVDTTLVPSLFALQDTAAAIRSALGATAGGLLEFKYKFSTAISATAPPAGYVKMNTGDATTATELYISDTDEGGAVFTELFNQLADGDRVAIRGAQSSNEDILFIFTITGQTDNTGWHTITVDNSKTVTQNGTIFANNSTVKILIQYALEVATDATLTGAGTAASPLGIAQQGATTGQVLKWNGSTWSPDDDATGGGGSTFLISSSTDLAGITANIGDRFKVRSTGAEYRVESSTVTGYNGNAADEAAVVTMPSSRFGVLRPTNGKTDVREFLGKNSWTVAQSFQAALNYTSALGSAETVWVDSTYNLAAGLTIPENSGLSGTSNNAGFNNLTPRKARLIFNLSNSATPAIQFDPASAGGYLEGVKVENLVIEASSAALCGILAKEPFGTVIQNVLIFGTASRFFQYGIICDGGISFEWPNIKIEGTARNGVYIQKGASGITTTTTGNFTALYVNDTEIGIEIDSAAGAAACYGCVLESLDSLAYLDHGQSTFKFRELWTESIGGPAAGKPIFEIGRGPANINANRGEFSIIGGRIGGTTGGGWTANSAAFSFNYKAKGVLQDLRVGEVGKTIQITANTGFVDMIDVWERSTDSLTENGAGIPAGLEGRVGMRNVGNFIDAQQLKLYYDNSFSGLQTKEINSAIDSLLPLWRQFGINPKDTLDDYAGIAAALSFLSGQGGGTLELPEGLIITSQAILVPDSCSIVGQGYGTLVQVDEIAQELGLYKGTIYTDGTGVRIANLRIDGRFYFDPALYDADSDAAFTNRSSGIELTLDSRSCIVENVWIENTIRHGILVSGGGHRVENIIIGQTNSFGISFGGQSNLISAGEYTSFDNIVRNIKLGPSHAKECIEINDGSRGILLDGFETFGQGHPAIFIHDHGNANETNYNITISNGTIHSAGQTTPQVQILGTSGNIHRNIFLKGLKIYSGAFGIDYQQGNQTTDNDGGPGIRINSYCENIVIDNCLIAAEEGVLINPAAANTAKRITVQNTVMYMVNDINAAGVSITNANEIVVNNCTITDYHGSGISAASPVGLVIRNNQIKNNSVIGIDYGIDLTGTGTDVKIENNYIGNDDGNTRQNYAISIAGTYSDLKVTGNTFDNHPTGVINGTIASTMYFRANQGLADDYVGATVGSFHAAITTDPSVATSGTAATLTFTSILENSGGFSLQATNTEVQYDGTNPHYFVCTATMEATTDVTGNFVLDLRGSSGAVVLGSQTITVLNTGDHVNFVIPIYQQLSNGGDFGFTVTGPTGNLTVEDLDLVCHQVR